MMTDVISVWKKSNISRSFNFPCKLSLMFRTNTGNKSWNNFSLFRNEFSQYFVLFVVDIHIFIFTESTNLFWTNKCHFLSLLFCFFCSFSQFFRNNFFYFFSIFRTFNFFVFILWILNYFFIFFCIGGFFIVIWFFISWVWSWSC